MEKELVKIISFGEKNIGRCYNETTYHVISAYPLTDKHLRGLRDAGFLTNGQEFYTKEILNNGSKVAVAEKADYQRLYSNPPVKEFKYECVVRVDSSD